MTQSEKFRAFAALHVPGDPVILYNAWDAGSAKVGGRGRRERDRDRQRVGGRRARL